METEQEKFERILKKAEELAQVLNNVEQMLEGMEYSDRISLLSTALMKTIVQAHETSLEVVADMGNIFATMITSYRMMNEIEDDEDDEDEGVLRQ